MRSVHFSGDSTGNSSDEDGDDGSLCSAAPSADFLSDWSPAGAPLEALMRPPQRRGAVGSAATGVTVKCRTIDFAVACRGSGGRTLSLALHVFAVFQDLRSNGKRHAFFLPFDPELGVFLCDSVVGVGCIRWTVFRRVCQPVSTYFFSSSNDLFACSPHSHPRLVESGRFCAFRDECLLSKTVLVYVFSYMFSS